MLYSPPTHPDDKCAPRGLLPLRPLTRAVAPATPTCEIPSSALSGTAVELHCQDKHSVPPARYKWFKDNKPLGPSGTANMTYTLDVNIGTLVRSEASGSIQS